MTQQQTQMPRRPKRFFETTWGALAIVAMVFVSIGAFVYITQYANPSYEERLRDAELECADLIDLSGTVPDTSKFDACVDYEMNH